MVTGFQADMLLPINILFIIQVLGMHIMYTMILLLLIHGIILLHGRISVIGIGHHPIIQTELQSIKSPIITLPLIGTIQLEDIRFIHKNDITS